MGPVDSAARATGPRAIAPNCLLVVETLSLLSHSLSCHLAGLTCSVGANRGQAPQVKPMGLPGVSSSANTILGTGAGGGAREWRTRTADASSLDKEVGREAKAAKAASCHSSERRINANVVPAGKGPGWGRQLTDRAPVSGWQLDSQPAVNEQNHRALDMPAFSKQEITGAFKQRTAFLNEKGKMTAV
ncbi:hypothetical protein AOLI_G00120540 [Acnodon oligacanthus]